MDKKTILLLIPIVLVIIFYWQILEFLGLYTPAPPVQTGKTDTTQVSTPPDSQLPVVLAPAAVQPVLDTTLAAAPVDTTTVSVDTVVITTKRYIATLITKGGGPISIKLEDYHYHDDRGNIEMVPFPAEVTPALAFSSGTFQTGSLPFVSSLSPGHYNASTAPVDVVYTYTNPQGGQIVKSYRFYPDDYHYDLTVGVNRREALGFERQYELMWNTPLGATEPDLKSDYLEMKGVARMGEDFRKLEKFEGNTLNMQESGTTAWAGVRSKYFTAVLIPMNKPADGVSATGSQQAATGPHGTYEKRDVHVGIEMPLAATSTFTDTVRVFVGPLDYTLMARYGKGLQDILDIGTTPVVGWIIKIFAVPIIWLLPKIYAVIPNYGFVIIIFALLVKLITLPLSLKSVKSMAGLKEIQPKMEELKVKHKNNPQALNAEMMKLYKQAGVNPVSGCLPILLQMPLFFAMFAVFRSTVLLRKAPFIGFVDDLSRGATGLTDPYIILVLLMVGSQFVSQMFTMASSQQNKMMMYILPLVMGFFFYTAPAGLVIYWTCFSILSLVDYYLFRRNQPLNPQIKTATT